MSPTTLAVRPWALLCWSLLAALGTACGGGAGNLPLAPTPAAAPAASGYLIAGPAILPMGSGATYTLVALQGGGMPVSNPNSVTWTTDNIGIARIGLDGRLTALASGGVTVTATYEGTTVTKSLRVAVHEDNPGRANLIITAEPDPAPGSMTICGGAFWGNQTPTWSTLEVIRETQGVGFTLELLTYNYYDQNGLLTRTISIRENHYFPPYDEHIEDGCVALGGARSGTFESIMEGVDDKRNKLTFAGRVRLSPVP